MPTSISRRALKISACRSLPYSIFLALTSEDGLLRHRQRTIAPPFSERPDATALQGSSKTRTVRSRANTPYVHADREKESSRPRPRRARGALPSELRGSPIRDLP